MTEDLLITIIVRWIGFALWAVIILRAWRVPERVVYANRPRRLMLYLMSSCYAFGYAFGSMSTAGLMPVETARITATIISALGAVLAITILMTPDRGPADPRDTGQRRRREDAE